jgi:phospholipid/cholesterol/gamma-HCH transport system substrate-binding protein
MQAVVNENRPALRDFSQSGLYEFTQFISEARTLIMNLSRLSSQLERDPAQFLFGNQQKGFEAR